jgi:hypothetical protein
MAEQIQDGTGTGNRAKVTSDKRLLTATVTEPLSAERSRKGKLFGVGTGNLSLSASFSGPVLWLRNEDSTQHMYVQKLIFGWNGGDTNRDRTVFSLINYNTASPTATNASTTFQIENIALSGTDSPVSLAKAKAQIWDGSGSTGMGGVTGGFAQIPNRLAKGNTSIPIDGEIILGANNSMSFTITPEEAGEFHVSVVVYMAPEGGVTEET